MVLDFYTDGSCWNKCEYGIGGWAYCIVHPDDENKLLGFNSGTITKGTSNLSEMAAVDNALKPFVGFNDFVLKKIRIHCDSAYVVNCFLEKWYEKWELMQYVGIQNAEQWAELISKVRKIRSNGIMIEFVKVKGHVGIKYNELVDDLAGEERQNEIKKQQNKSNFDYKARRKSEELLEA